jgi:hypothetical protein
MDWPTITDSEWYQLPSGKWIRILPGNVRPRPPAPPTERIPITPIKPPGTPGIVWWLRNAWFQAILLAMDGHEGDADRACSNVRSALASPFVSADNQTRIVGNMLDALDKFLTGTPAPVDPCRALALALKADAEGTYFDLLSLYNDYAPFASLAWATTNPQDPTSWTVSCAELLDKRNGFLQAASLLNQEYKRLSGVVKDLARQLDRLVTNCGVPAPEDRTKIKVPSQLPAPVTKRYSQVGMPVVTDPTVDTNPKGWNDIDPPGNLHDGVGYTPDQLASAMAADVWTYFRVTIDPGDPWAGVSDYPAMNTPQ